MTTQAKKNYTLPIVVMFFLFAMISFVTGFQNPFGVILKDQLGLSALQSQLGNAANFIAYAFMGLPAGMILQSRGYKFTAIAAVLCGIAGVAIMFVSSFLPTDSIFGVYLTGAFVAGFSMCMLNTVVNPMLNTLGGGGAKGNQLLQFGGSCNSLAATICPVLAGYMMGGAAGATMNLVDARPLLYIALGIFLLALIVLCLSKLPEPILEQIKEENGKEVMEVVKDKPTIGGAFKFSHFVGGIIAIFLYVGIEVGIPNFANLFMVEQGVAVAAAGTIVGMYWLLMLCGRLVGGALGSKVSPRTMLTVVSGVACVLLACAIFWKPENTMLFPGFTTEGGFAFVMTEVPVNVMFLVLCGLCTSVMWGGIFNLAVEGLGRYTAVASGLFMVMVCGGGIVPLVQGFVADRSGYLAGYWVLFACAAYLLYYALIGSRVLRRDNDIVEMVEE